MSSFSSDENDEINSQEENEDEDKKKSMRAVQGKDYGDIDEMISVEENIPIPSLFDLPPKKRKKSLLIKTLAVALAPGDCRVLSGLTRELQGPPSFPYIPGADCCGIVVEVPQSDENENGDDDCYFKVGDYVAARFVDEVRGALGEYAIIRQEVCDRIPSELATTGSPDEFAALASASPSFSLAQRIQKGERILVLGAGGGIGSHFCQIAKTHSGASYVAGVSRDPGRLLEEPINCDLAIDYTKDDIFAPEVAKQWKEKPFDVIVDLAGGNWLRLIEESKKKNPMMIVKSASEGGRYLTTTPDSAIFEAHSMWGIMNIFLLPSLRRAIRSRYGPWSRMSLPAYTFAMSLDSTRDVMTKTLSLAKEGKLKACIDNIFPFTTEGVRYAFKSQASRHARGKVVIHVADRDAK